MPGPVRRHPALARFAPLALMPAAAFAVHQLRYWLAYGGHAAVMLERQGHAYLQSLIPWIVLLLAVLAGAFLRALGRALGGQLSVRRYTVSFTALWLACAVSLIALYATQELLESWLATGHPAGLAGVFGYGGWWAIPASACVALVLAALLHGARWVLAAAAEWSARARILRSHRAPRPRAPRPVLLALPAPVASGWSDRGPPH